MTVPGLLPHRATLDNGAVVIVKETHKTPVVALNVAVRAGSICDPADRPGAMYLLSRVIDRGTARRPGDEIAEALDSRGISLTITVTRHQLTAVCTCLAEDFEEVLALVGEVMMMPTVPDADTETRKGEVITAIRQDQDNPAVRAVEGLMAALYGPTHPYGRPQKGTIASVDASSALELRQLHAETFGPGRLSAVIVGDVDAGRAVDVAGRVFAGWQVPEPKVVMLPTQSPPGARRRIVVPMMNKAQVDIAYGFVSITRSDPAYYTYWLLNNALGQYA